MRRPLLEGEEPPNPNNKALKMVCASLYVPKDNLLKPMGDDAHFVCADHEVVGVADGVGGWTTHGVDAGEYARELMLNSTIAVLRHSSDEGFSSPIIEPIRVLREAFAGTDLPGSSTACIVAHRRGVLRSANVGDSGFMLFRSNRLVHRSRTQQKRFNCPYQLGNAEKSDRPDCAEEAEIAVAAGDIIVLGTDGLLDNMFENEVEQILERESASVSGGGERGLDELQKIANFIADIALNNSLDPVRDSPFSLAAKRANKFHSGGKKDDITVIVCQIVTSST